MPPPTPRTILITGLGTVSALGTGIEDLWCALLDGKSGLGPIMPDPNATPFDPAGFRSKLGGRVPEFSAKKFVPKHYRKAVKVMARDIQLAVGAAHFAVQDAGLITRANCDDPETSPPTYPSNRVGCQIGAGLIAAETAELAPAAASAADETGTFSTRLWGTNTDEGGTGGMNNLPPLWLLKYLPNMPACHVTILHGCEGPSNTITCAEASGLLSLGESLRVIQRGDADCCFTGGAESKLNFMGMARLDLAGRLAETGDAEEGAPFVRPFDPEAPGTLLAEGGGVLILEEAESAKARGARIYAEVAGFGAAQGPPPFGAMGLATSPGSESQTTDTPARLGEPGHQHTTDESPSDGLRFAIEAALADAGIAPDQIDAIIPTGAGVTDADQTEAEALRALFGERLGSIPLVTIRPNLGDCQAGNGALQAAVAAMCLREQRLPARLHAGTPVSGLDAGQIETRDATLGCVLVCSTSLGGQNAAVVLRAIASDAATPACQG